jgi:MFS family permease
LLGLGGLPPVHAACPLADVAAETVFYTLTKSTGRLDMVRINGAGRSRTVVHAWRREWLVQHMVFTPRGFAVEQVVKRVRASWTLGAPGVGDWLAAALMPALFFLSGFAALCYQIAWQRSLFGWFGVDLDSVSVIVSVFMLGLGGGALIGGWLADRFARARILSFSVIEMMIAVFGVVSLDVIDASGVLFSNQPLPVMIGITFLVLLVPTFAMGATLPILVTELTERSGNVGGAIGQLYFINTMGAAVGSLAAAYVILPLVGLGGLTNVAATLNFVISIAAAAQYSFARSKDTP